MKHRMSSWIWAVPASVGLLVGAGAQAQRTVVYRCPGNPVLYTDALSVKDAKDKGCTALESAPLTIVQGVRPRGTPVPSATGSNTAPSPPGARIEPSDQRARDNDARRILEAELQREEERLNAMKAEYNNGQPERRGDEKNYQKYIDRVAELKAGIARKESDVGAIRRELAKTPQ